MIKQKRRRQQALGGLLYGQVNVPLLAGLGVASLGIVYLLTRKRA